MAVMLIEFTVRNYRSFKDDATLSLEATSLTSRDKRVDEGTIFEVNGLRLLTGAAIYGANASGKSNLAKAFVFMQSFIRNSSNNSQAGDPINVEPFALHTETRELPAEFEMSFIMDGTQYRYGFAVSPTHVTREWLYTIRERREVRLFTREEQDITLSPTFKAEGMGITDKTRDNALFLSVVAQFNGTISKSILQWFQKCQLISGLHDIESFSLTNHTIRSLSKSSHKTNIVRLIKGLDVDIDDIQLREPQLDMHLHVRSDIPDELKALFESFNQFTESDIVKQYPLQRPSTAHAIYNENGEKVDTAVFDMELHESEGTKKLFALATLLLDVLREGQILIIDEFDARLHPNISREIVRLFNTAKTNPHHAQLVFMTHDTHLLDRELLRRDQIWFVEKDRYGASHLYSLAELKVRNDASFERDYITGRYGAIPFLGDLRFIIEEALEDEHDETNATQA